LNRQLSNPQSHLRSLLEYGFSRLRNTLTIECIADTLSNALNVA
jgi:hypothetical protein